MKTSAHWKLIEKKSHHGLWICLASLRTKKSCGVGEFLDLLPLIRWCPQIGFDCIQLLPLNDSGDDPSPYNPISSCALDPIYLSLHDLPKACPDTLLPLQKISVEKRLVKYQVKEAKLQWLFRYFESVFQEFAKTPSYQTFVKEHRSWLEEYCEFQLHKKVFQKKHWQEWPQEPSFSSSELRLLDFYRFVQFLCFLQLYSVHQQALQQGVFLCGDIPILLNPDSADVWKHRRLFRLDLQAGSPPDYYTPDGQLWGFPLFNWKEMNKQHNRWWKQRLRIASTFYDLYRIDHAVGFFRIWAIPPGKTAQEGFFVPQDVQVWESQGKERLEMMLQATNMLPIAEDLGTVLPEVSSVLRKLDICGTIVMRWERKRYGWQPFIPSSKYKPLSIATVSTPDSETLSMWWKNYPDESVLFAEWKKWRYAPELSYEQRLAILKEAHDAASYFHVNLLQEYLALFPELAWQDPRLDRINRPGTLLPSNWTYRYRPFVEEIVAHEKLTLVMRYLASSCKKSRIARPLS